MANREKQKIVTRKHLARQEREALQTRYIKYATYGVLAIVIILVAIALIDAFIITPNKPVAIVNGDDIAVSDYQARVKFERFQMISQMSNTIQFMQNFGDESTASYFQSSLQQIAFQLNPEIHGQSVVDTMVDDSLIRQEAERRGITVSETEIDEAIAQDFGFYPDGTPTPAPTSEPIPTSTFNPQQLTLVAPSPTDVLTGTESLTATATPVVEPTPTEEPVAAPTEELPTPTAYTEAMFNENYQTYINDLGQYIQLSETQFRDIVRAQLLREKLLAQISKDVPQEEQQIWARHILVVTEEEAQAVVARLEAGEDFAAVAQEVSTDTGSAVNGGDLGWFGRGRMVAPFEDTAFALEIGEISAPVESQFGWHIIQKLGDEIRPLDDATHEQNKQTVFNEWLTVQREEADIETFDTWGEAYPEIPIIPPEYLSFIGQP